MFEDFTHTIINTFKKRIFWKQLAFNRIVEAYTGLQLHFRQPISQEETSVLCSTSVTFSSEIQFTILANFEAP